ncbi:flagellar hook capping FlgD N-terminal domain-containing protein [Labrenzia sp. OB1]|uniref:flagellar hook assembly protein FlgD n=1 Tax=Labrenzia sp. OB1 TaxID=1561204 RepID=UPI0007B28A71|nr:flagellar hook capping FlgD N-terminal domain-containing protein [Labrenzia sp. OB1]KZM49586.1 flagellar hook capping protein [Labrenzia sp. OB1]
MTTVTSASSALAQTQSATSQEGLMANYDLFLSILTTQIQNQDPLDPMDSAEYTSQLVQYSTVEQGIQQNKNLENIIATLQSNQSMSYVSYIGNEVSADASTTLLSGDVASWDYEIQEDASGTYEIRDASGDVVASGDIELAAGSGTFMWDGQKDSGTEALPGSYTISFDMQDASSRSENVKTEIKGIVDSVDWSSGEPVLKVDGRSIPVSSVTSVSSPS